VAGGAAVRFEREVPLVIAADEAWRALAALPPARGSAAGYDGSVVLEEADDEAHTATLRLRGVAGAATVSATAAVTVHEGGLAITAVLRQGLGGAPLDEATAEDALGRLATALAYALATVGKPRSAWDKGPAPSPTPATAWDAPGPTLPAAAIADEAPPRADAPPRAEAPPPAAVVPFAEVLTPRPHDVVHPGQELEQEEPAGDPSRWVKVGVAAAAGLAVLRIVRGRR
jgi:hypothetical protein